MTDLKAYQEMVNEKAAVKSSDILPNAGKDHAAIVMSKMFDLTTQNANMMVGSFDGQISDQDNYLKSLEGCIDRGVSFHVLILDKINPHSKAYQLLLKKQAEGRDIVIKDVAENTKIMLPKNTEGKIVHFSTFDDDKYRFEKDTEKYLAWFCFNDKKNVETINKYFNLAISQG